MVHPRRASTRLGARPGPHGVPAVLVERRSGPSVHPRATGIGPRSVEVLRELGLDAAVDALAVDLRGAVGKAVARTVVEMGAGDVVTVPMPATSAGELDVAPFRLRGVCAQDRLDAVVAADLARRGADLGWSTRLVAIAQDADGVDVELEGPEGRYSLRCTRVVAADGTHSTVRTALGVGTSGPGDLGKSVINILFRADLRPHLRGMSFATCTITTPEAPGLLDTYAHEREPVAAATLDQAMRRLADPELHWGRGPEADAARAAAGVWAAPVVHLGQRYDSAAVVDPRPELPSTVDLDLVLDGSPGSRVPRAWIDGVSTLDLVASRWTLLAGVAGERWLTAAADAGLSAHRVAAAWLPDEGALLVRPDGIVAMRATESAKDPARFLTEVLDQVLARPVPVPRT
ncbi:FAD-dependent monooxygenase [Streptomyces sp. NBC_01343]|uniref:FAD-dependent monooxygenase n=1 Tax=Streptomyces sp. NBC_01343 TaxID=2903832 RepID=UPI002E120A14|nr:FAD-dependent monooxygenase [Streptomyces sp. NBC_01343]